MNAIAEFALLERPAIPALLLAFAVQANRAPDGRELTPFFSAQTPPLAPGYYFVRYARADVKSRRYWDGENWHFLANVPAPSSTFGDDPDDRWQAAFTDWFPPSVAPAHVGLYTRRYPDAECLVQPDYWDGIGWRVVVDGDASVAGSACFAWRGIEPIAVAS